MTSVAQIARPYAKAVFQYAEKQGETASWLVFLERFAALVETPESQKIAYHPTWSREKIVASLLALFPEKPTAAQQRLVQQLSEKKRFAVVPWIYQLVMGQKAEQEQILAVHFETAFPVDTAYLKNLEEKLSQRYQSQITIQHEVDKHLIGGAILSIGDQVYDGSIRSKLSRMLHDIKV